MGNVCSSPATATAPADQSAPQPAPAAASAPATSEPAAAAAATQPAAAAPAEAATDAAPVAQGNAKAKIAIVYYSMYGHIATMAKAVAKGVEAAGAEVKLYQVPETLPQEVLDLMHAPAKDASVATITDAADLVQYDGILFGIPTRFGMMPAQLKAFFDSTGGLWAKGALVGKPAGLFFSTGIQGGGQETTAFTALTSLTHHGMIYIPIGPSAPSLFNMDEIHGGSAYGAGSLAGAKGERQPTELELGVATHQGTHFTTIATALKVGRAA